MWDNTALPPKPLPSRFCSSHPSPTTRRMGHPSFAADAGCFFLVTGAKRRECRNITVTSSSYSSGANRIGELLPLQAVQDLPAIRWRQHKPQSVEGGRSIASCHPTGGTAPEIIRRPATVRRSSSSLTSARLRSDSVTASSESSRGSTRFTAVRIQYFTLQLPIFRHIMRFSCASIIR